MKTAIIFGGTFDPIHLGHVSIVEQVIAKFNPDIFFIVPTANHPFKKNIGTDFEHRFRMCEIAFSFLGDKVKISRMQLKNKKGYYIDLIKLFRKKYPKYNFLHVIGEDCAVNLVKWKNGSRLVKNEKFIVFERKVEGEIPWYKTEDNTFLELHGNHFISSSGIRENLKKHGKIKDSELFSEVLDYIKKNDLYS